ncbi:MAG: dihydrodipicolinate synthase family protein [Clostridia bacterium]|nr:dihydrodipicolinate synthase family protein [Clostridia bacterium]
MKKLHGVTVAMVTPFDTDGGVDVAALRTLTNALVEKGVDCLYPCGTTGEMLRLTVEERKLVAETVVQAAAGRVTVFIHVGSMRQDDTIALARHAQEIGADGIGVVTPQFFTVNDREMEAYFVAVARSVPGFLMYLYNIPQCAANDLKPEVVARVCAQCDNVVGIKYSFADMARTLQYIAVKDGFSVLHGMDKLLVSLLDMGCEGTVSGCAGVVPEPYVACMKAYRAGDMEAARRWGRVCVRVTDILRGGSNMSFFKEAITARGLKGGVMRAPQLDIPADERDAMIADLKQALADAGIAFELA